MQQREAMESNKFLIHLPEISGLSFANITAIEEYHLLGCYAV
jgi:hypothetical protein